MERDPTGLVDNERFLAINEILSNTLVYVLGHLEPWQKSSWELFSDRSRYTRRAKQKLTG